MRAGDGRHLVAATYNRGVGHPNLILMGLRGSGKSTLGRALGAALGREVVDLDDLTPVLLGCASIAQAWSAAGEPGFREAEARALGEVLSRDNQVIALGGGTPTAPGAADLLRAHRAATGARLIYLRAGAEELRARLGAADNSHRPPLTPGARDPIAEIEAVHAARDPLYLALADDVLEVAGRSLQQCGESLVELARGGAGA